MQLTILGCGSSAGTPAIGCQCKTCLSTNPKNVRSRCSSIIQLDSGHTLLIDTGPDLRQQALREHINKVDAVLYTHTHADHLHGIDDLRAFCQINRMQIPLYGNADAVAHIASKFAYTLREPSNFWDLPVLKSHVIEQAFELFNTQIIPIPVMHGKISIMGYRIGNLAYLTDISHIPDTSLKLLENLDYLLIDCLRIDAHPTHVNLEQSLDWIACIGAKQNVMIHMTHELEYEELSHLLPENTIVGYDGLKLSF
jgi:phosphoribosyl 1,2-cyclic phosphate phosphodiesterase